VLVLLHVEHSIGLKAVIVSDYRLVFLVLLAFFNSLVNFFEVDCHLLIEADITIAHKQDLVWRIEIFWKQNHQLLAGELLEGNSLQAYKIVGFRVGN
jgi:hypothetical protein